MGTSEHERQKLFWETDRERRDPNHPVVQAFAEPKVDFINRIVLKTGEKHSLSLLDIGCGNGFFTNYLKDYYHTFAIDFSEHMLQINRCGEKICGSATELPFKNNSFDITFCSNLLHHLENPQEALLEMRRVSRKYVILSEPNRSNPLMFLFGLFNKIERGTLKFSLEYMIKLLEETQLIVITASGIGAVLPNKTPSILLPFITKLDGEFPLGFYNIVIAKKVTGQLNESEL